MNHIEKKKKNIEKILTILMKGKISNESFNSSKEPFFKKDFYEKDFEINKKEIKNFPEGLNHDIKLIYNILGDPDKEIYLGDWTIMSLKSALESYKDYCENGQNRVFDIGFRYMGMGHIELISCDLETHLLLYHMGGGSNGWDREANYKDILNYDGKDAIQINFEDWFYKIDLDQ